MDNHGSTVTTRMDLADWAVDDRDAGSPLRALIAAEVILVPRLVQPSRRSGLG
jgi:hypothetical protein